MYKAVKNVILITINFSLCILFAAYRTAHVDTLSVSFIRDDHINAVEKYIDGIYDRCGLSGSLEYTIFRYGVIGYLNLRTQGLLSDREIIAVVDYTKCANDKRFFVIDLANGKILYNTLVAHGKNTGNKYAKHFSNEPRSLKSSIGFYITGNTYYGKHGYSLSLDGVDTLYNDNARKRSVVMHGAHYVSEEFAKQYGRIGRSWGCPALPENKSSDIIDTIKNGCCLFVYYCDEQYLTASQYLEINGGM